MMWDDEDGYDKEDLEGRIEEYAEAQGPEMKQWR